VTDYVVDASVAVKWVVQEDYSEQAAKMLEGDSLHAPAHWMAETVNALWGKVLRGALTADAATERAEALLNAPVRVHALPGLVQNALSLSMAHGITVYDSLYVALAIASGLKLITDDRTLIQKLSASSVPPGLFMWVGDLA
jgi:predicted nucleic acid-binding protein